MATLTPDTAAQAAEPVAAPTPTEGGSYWVNEATGALTLIERTQPQEPHP